MESKDVTRTRGGSFHCLLRPPECGTHSNVPLRFDAGVDGPIVAVRVPEEDDLSLSNRAKLSLKASSASLDSWAAGFM